MEPLPIARYHLENDNPLEFALYGLARQREFPAWVEANKKLPMLELGAGLKRVDGAIPLDWPEYNFEAQHAFVVPMLVNAKTDLSEYADNSIGAVFATHVLEHIFDPRPLIAEVARVLAPGAPFNILVPHGQSISYMQDMDHKRPFVLDSWKNFLSNGYYEDRRGGGLHLRVGANFKFAIKEGNEAIVTQLVKSDDPWEYATGSDEVELEGERHE